MAPTITNLQVQSFDNGSAYGEKYVTGNIEDNFRLEAASYVIYVDDDGDGDLSNAETCSYHISAESFAYLISNNDQSGSVVVRIAKVYSNGGATDWSAAASASFDLDYAHNELPEFAHKSIDYYTGSSQYGTLYVRFRDFTRGGSYRVEYDANGDDVADQTRGLWPGSVLNLGVQAYGAGPQVRIVERLLDENGQLIDIEGEWEAVGTGGPGPFPRLCLKTLCRH